MLAYIAKRLLLMLPTLLGVLLLTFAVIQFVPGGPVEQYLAEARTAAGKGGGGAESGGMSYRGDQGVDPKRLEQIKALYGFDKPAHERFLQMLSQFARFDLGQSFFQNKKVWDLVLEKLPVSISLGLWTFFISYLVAVPLGVAKAVRAGATAGDVFDAANAVYRPARGADYYRRCGGSMGLTLDPAQAATFVMASVRIMAFLLVAPPFAGAMVPTRVKVGMSVVLAMIVTPRMTETLAGVDTASVIAGIVFQAAMGAALGFIILILFSAVQAAGQLIDFSAAPA